MKKIDITVHNNFHKQTNKTYKALSLILKWAPIASLFALDFIDKQPKDKRMEHFIDVVAAELLLQATVQPLKYIVKRVRPNGDSESFPSAHTATSFLGSELLRKNYKDTYPLLNYASYAVAIGAGALRLYQNKHWLSDVFAGAVLGAAAVELSPRLMDAIIEKVNIEPAVY